MSVEHTKSELTVEQQKTIVVLSNTVAQMWREINYVRGQLSSKDTAVPDAPLAPITSTSKASSASGGEESLQVQVEDIFKEDVRQNWMAAWEELIGKISSTQQFDKLTEMQQTVDDLRASNAELNASNINLRASNMELTRRVCEMEVSVGELRRMVVECHKSWADQSDLSNAAAAASSFTASTSPVKAAISMTGMALTATVACTAPSPSNVPVSTAVTTKFPLPLRIPSASLAEHIETLSRDLWEAADEGNTPRVCQLVAEGANVEYINQEHETALHRAALFGHVEAVRALIKLGARLEARNTAGNTPLYYTIWYKHEKCVILLLSVGASVHATNKWGSTPLHHAARYGTPSIVKFLIAAGADLGVKNRDSKIPKDWAKSGTIHAML